MAERKTSSKVAERLVVVVGIDFAAQGDEAFAAAWDWTRARDAEIHGESVVNTAPCAVLVARPKKAAGLPQTLGISPPCKDCLVTRTETSGAEWWCARHASHARLPLHVYSYERELPLSSPR